MVSDARVQDPAKAGSWVQIESKIAQFRLRFDTIIFFIL